MLIELTLRESIVAAPATVVLDVVSPAQTRSEWAVAPVASIVKRGVLSMRIMNLSGLGCETSAA